MIPLVDRQLSSCRCQRLPQKGQSYLKGLMHLNGLLSRPSLWSSQPSKQVPPLANLGVQASFVHGRWGHMKMLLLARISSPRHSPFMHPERASHTPCCPGGGAGGNPAGHAPRQTAVESPGPTAAAAQLVHRVLAVQCLLPRSSGGGATDSR